LASTENNIIVYKKQVKKDGDLELPCMATRATTRDYNTCGGEYVKCRMEAGERPP
jgi:hypothetical protein